MGASIFKGAILVHYGPKLRVRKRIVPVRRSRDIVHRL